MWRFIILLVCVSQITIRTMRTAHQLWLKFGLWSTNKTQFQGLSKCSYHSQFTPIHQNILFLRKIAITSDTIDLLSVSDCSNKSKTKTISLKTPLKNSLTKQCLALIRISSHLDNNDAQQKLLRWAPSETSRSIRLIEVSVSRPI